jgi:hypothetical protein
MLPFGDGTELTFLVGAGLAVCRNAGVDRDAAVRFDHVGSGYMGICRLACLCDRPAQKPRKRRGWPSMITIAKMIRDVERQRHLNEPPS